MKNCTKAEYKVINKTIKESGLRDFTEWVDDHADVMAKANGLGDTLSILSL